MIELEPIKSHSAVVGIVLLLLLVAIAYLAYQLQAARTELEKKRLELNRLLADHNRERSALHLNASRGGTTVQPDRGPQRGSRSPPGAESSTLVTPASHGEAPVKPSNAKVQQPAKTSPATVPYKPRVVYLSRDDMQGNWGSTHVVPQGAPQALFVATQTGLSRKFRFDLVKDEVVRRRIVERPSDFNSKVITTRLTAGGQKIEVEEEGELEEVGDNQFRMTKPLRIVIT